MLIQQRGTRPPKVVDGDLDDDSCLKKAPEKIGILVANRLFHRHATFVPVPSNDVKMFDASYNSPNQTKQL